MVHRLLAGAPPSHGLLAIAALHHLLIYSPPLAPAKEALAERQGLCRSLLELALAAAAVGMQVPPERRDPTLSCDAVAKVAGMVCDPGPLCTGLLDLLQAASPVAAGALRAATRLALLAPAARADDFSATYAACLFERLSLLLRNAVPVALSAGAAQDQQAAAEQLLVALPGLQCWLQLVAAGAGLPDEVAAHGCTWWARLLERIGEWSDPWFSDLPPSLSAGQASKSMSAWCNAAVAALRCLPAVLQLARQVAQQGQQVQQSSPAGDLVPALLQFTHACMANAEDLREARESSMAGQPGPACSDGRLEACTSAAFLLHSTLCRAVYWLLAGGSGGGDSSTSGFGNRGGVGGSALSHQQWTVLLTTLVACLKLVGQPFEHASR